MSVETREGGCHCGRVRFRATLPQGLASASRCSCSFCRMRGAVAVTALAADFEVLKGADALTLYQWGSRTARHYFCSVCGIYTHHRRRLDPAEMGVNLACLDGCSPFDLTEVPVFDGTRHPSDGHEERLAGLLRFTPESR
ncbi:MAG: GFA family protein [Paracoccaceae bacterium]|nr:GFA family protein [Paracoccaceae bacterium]